MASKKWGESFLKSGLPLEHLTAVTLRSVGWDVEAPLEYQRAPDDPSQPWFELDFFAASGTDNTDTELGLLGECKYHDTSRFWMFLPLEADGGWMFDDAVLNCGPFQTLRKPRDSTILPLAPLSTNGVVLSEDGTKQDNAIYTAVQQLANAFVPYGAAGRLFDFNFEVREPAISPCWVTALVPIVVTNAALFRLRPDVQDLEVIRRAASPSDIADAVPWTWCRHDDSLGSYDATLSVIDTHIETHSARFKKFPLAEKRIREFAHRPHWIAIVNVESLGSFAQSLEGAFHALKTRSVRSLIRSRRAGIHSRNR